VTRKLGWVWLMGVFDVLCWHCGCFVSMVGRLCCSFGGSYYYGGRIVVSAVSYDSCILCVVAMVSGGVVWCSVVVLSVSSVGVWFGFVCVACVGCVGVWSCVGWCRVVWMMFAVVVAVVGGAVSFLSAYQRTCEVYPLLHPNFSGFPS
jgi:hypothetical protein